MVKSYLDYVAQETPPSFSAAAENSPRRTTFITATYESFSHGRTILPSIFKTSPVLSDTRFV